MFAGEVAYATSQFANSGSALADQKPNPFVFKVPSNKMIHEAFNAG